VRNGKLVIVEDRINELLHRKDGYRPGFTVRASRARARADV